MLTVDHVRARRKDHELQLTSLSPTDEAIALDLGSQLIVALQRGVGRKREEILDELADIVVHPRLIKVIEGLKKLLLDRCSFESPDGIDPVALRALVFREASSLRAQLAEGERFERQSALIVAAASLEIDIYRIDDVLFSDLKGEQRLIRFDSLHPQQLIEQYTLAQEQAVLLRASELIIRVRCDSPATYRYLFRQLKFRRLLFEIAPIYEGRVYLETENLTPSTDPDEYELKVSGPHNLFKASTKYGLQLALLLPILRVCETWRLSAKIYWGKERKPLDFFLDHQRSTSLQKPDASSEVELPDEVETLLTQLKKHKTQWRARRSTKIIHLPGVGLCIPDLVFSHPERKERVYFEVMGYWSRESVWRRIELVEAGLSERVIFAVSSRLRVSERALEDELPSALLVYKGAIMIHRLVELLDQLVPDDEVRSTEE